MFKGGANVIKPKPASLLKVGDDIKDLNLF